MQGLQDLFVHTVDRVPVYRLRDRADAGQQLAQKLMHYRDHPDVLVLGLPRGGVPVAYEIAKALHVPLDIFVVRKLGVPGHEELAMGALASGGTRLLNDDVVQSFAIPLDVIEAVTAIEQREINRREHAYYRDHPRPDLHDKTIILVDDGIATGATLRAAIATLRTQAPAKIIVAIGVAPQETCEQLIDEVDELVCLLTPEPFWSVGTWFENFDATSDEEVRILLAHAMPRSEAEKLDPTKIG